MKKVLSIIVACVMLVSMMAITSFAASVNHNLVLSATSTNVKAGDTVTVTATIDTSANLTALSLYLAVPDVFEIDNSGTQADLFEEYEITIPNYVNTDWAIEYFDQKSKYILANETFGTDSEVEAGHNVVILTEAKAAGISEANAQEDMDMYAFDMTVADNAAAGEYQIYVYANADKKYSSGTTDIGQTDTAAFNCIPLTITVEGSEPAAPTADSIGLWTGGVAKLTNQAVTNSDGSKYEVKTGLAFLSCVKTEANATDLKTVITCEGREGELVIAAGDKVYVDTDDKLTYFGAAVTSIRDINLDRAFTAKAVATVGETVVTGNGATATYAE